MKRALICILALLALPAFGFGAEGRIVLLDFHADWCGPCQQMRPAVQRLSEMGYTIKSIDVDRSPELARRYNVQNVPTFVVVTGDGRELGRTSGSQPAGNLAKLYHAGFAKLGASSTEVDPGRTAEESENDSASTSASDESEDTDAPKAPDPWETSVRIKTYGHRSIGFGSGTIIHSTPSVTVILTCAHIFEEGKGIAPSKFPRKVVVDLFDGQLHGTHPAMVHPVETEIPAEVIDYDFDADVGLIRIRPGRKLKASPVVPPTWQPRPDLKMNTVGCSGGQNATAWTTRITNPRIQGLVGRSRYEAIECQYAPKEGRSGGGLFTLDGHLAGVCDFAEPRGGHGLYATPRSIYRILDKHQLTFCYNPRVRNPETLLAARDSGHRATPASASASASTGREATKLRAQDSGLSERYPMPDPERLGIHVDPIAQTASARTPAKPNSDERGWSAPGSRQSAPPVIEQALPTEIKVNVRQPEPDSPAPQDFDRGRSRPSFPDPGAWKALRPSGSAN